MSTDNKMPTHQKRNPFLTWEVMLIYSLLCAVVFVLFERPVGSISGKIALEEQKFGLYSYNIRQNKVFAVATGPRDAITIARGVWVNNDGTFTIDQLPVGEYELKVRAPGFQTEYVNNIFVLEGKKQDLPNTIKMSVLQPSISVATNVRVFTTKENPSFWINATGAVVATVKLYKKNFITTQGSKALSGAGVSTSQDLSLYTSYNQSFENPFEKEKPFKEITRELKCNFEDSARSDFKLESLPPGDYFVVAEAVDASGVKNSAAITWFTVSDIGLIVKHGPDQMLVRAIDLNTLQPLSGVKLRVASKDSPNANFGESTTGADGLAIIKGFSGGYESIIIGQRSGQVAYASGGYFYGGDENTTTYFYTDRPIYRLGQTVMFKGILRDLEPQGFINEGAGQELTVTIDDPSNVQLYSGTIKTSKHGTFTGRFDVPEDGKTGAYSVKLGLPNRRTAYEYFEVDQYRKPEYKIDVTPEMPRVTAGSHARAKISATYFFGGPVANARIKYTVYSSSDWSLKYKLQPRPDYYSFFDDWEDEGTSNYDYGGSMVAEGFAQTDANGQATIEFNTNKIIPDTTPSYWYNYNDMNYKVEAEVTDISRLTANGSGNLSVTAGDFELFVNATSYVVKPNEDVEADILALDYDGKPVANQKVNLKISRFPWNAVTHAQEKEQVLGSVEVMTDAEGKAHLKTSVGTSWPTDTFYIIGKAMDKKGNTIMQCDSIWVSNYSYPFRSSKSEKEPFKLSFDKKVYKPGDTAKIMISGPFKGDEGYDALVTVEGTGLYEYRIVPLKATANLVQVPIKLSYAPNVFIGVTMAAKKKQFFQSNKMIMVSPNEHFLKVAISTDKEKYKPGEVAKYTIKATFEDGRPAPNTELSLGVVDESIYSIRPETAGDIRKAFYRKRYNKVSTFCSFPEQYSGGPDKTADEPKLRKNFKDTAAWFPSLVTDKDGIARAQVALPDNLTTWRATVRGVTIGADVGAGIQKIMVSQDIIARLALPRFFTEGDQGELTAVVHNYSDRDQNIKLSLYVSDQFKTNLPLSQNLSVGKEKAARFIWPVTITRPGKGVIRLKATGITGGDYLERTLPINSLGVPFFSAFSGVLTDKNPSVDITLAEPGETLSPSLNVSLAGSTIGEMQGAYDGLIDYPYGCTEQTMSRLFPSIIAMQLHQKLHVPLEEASIKRFEKVRQKAMAKLSEHHHSDGGWGWWKGDNSDPYMTSLVLEGLDLLNKTGYEADQGMIDSGVQWLTNNSDLLLKQLTDPRVEKDYMYETRRCDMTRLAYTLSVYKKRPSPQLLDWLRKNTNHFTPEPLAYTTMALQNFGDRAGVRKAYDRLLSLANKSETTVDWEHTRDMMKRLDLMGAGEDWTYRYTGEETTALALRAVLAVEPKNETLVENIKTWLLLHREKDGWTNTKTTAEALLALMQDALLNDVTTGSGVTARLIVNDALAQETSFATNEIYNPERKFQLPFNLIKGSKLVEGNTVKDLAKGNAVVQQNKLRIEKNGFGKLYYQSQFGFTRRIRVGDKIPVKNAPEGLSITREFFRIESQPAGSDGVIHLIAKPFDMKTPLKEGETILMKVHVQSPISLPYVIVESPLPSGAEVVKSEGAAQAATQATNNQEDASGISGDWGRIWWSHQDVLDDKIVFFGTEVPAGKSEFHTLLRMELPGKVQINPVRLEGMYSKLIRGYSQSAELIIK